MEADNLSAIISLTLVYAGRGSPASPQRGWLRPPRDSAIGGGELMPTHPIPADPGRGRGRPLDVILSDELEDVFDVVDEAVPSGWPTTFRGQTVTWFSNFSLRKKAGREKTGVRIAYTIELDSVGDKKLVYYEPETGTLGQLNPRGVGSNRIQADLFADDPGVGHT
jgi:hypothetical protein